MIRLSRKGFTLVELMIVIAILGILASTLSGSYIAYIDRSKVSQTKLNLHYIAQVIEDARLTTNNNLGQITGSYCTDCNCRNPPQGPFSGSLLGLPDTDVCVQGWKTAIDNIYILAGRASGEARRFYRDPWTVPYFLDENEGETIGSCDTLGSSMGEDNIWGSKRYNIPIARISDGVMCP